jgi:threonine dehydrogenase-like Zn-dependent dehydrogenase
VLSEKKNERMTNCPLVLGGRIDPGKVFDQTLPLEQVADGYRAIKTLLMP